MSNLQECFTETDERFRDQMEDEDPSGEDHIIQTHLNEDGSTSNYFDKRKLKIAPRSTLQFKVGPPFELVASYNSVVESDTFEKVSFQINPRIDRGFDFIDDGWVGYKRNYFTLVSSFETPGLELDTFLNSSFTVKLHDSHNSPDLQVKYFAVKIRARSDDDRTEICLVQHTAKRDKGPQFAPGTCPLVPSALPQHQTIREASNVRNSIKMRKYDSTFFFHRDKEREKYNVHGIVYTYPDECIQKVARYERVQFASSINIKKPSQQNKHFRLHIILGAVTCPPRDSSHFEGFKGAPDICMMTSPSGAPEYFVPLQEMRTPPLIIRGRSPSNYTSSQRVAVRASSSIGLTKKNPNSSTSPAILPSRSPMPLNVTPPTHDTVNRTSKRRSKIPEDVPSKPSLINAGVEESQYRTVRRVETIEHIEKLYQDKKSLILRHPNESNWLRDENDANDVKRPKISRHSSIDPREIELKPTRCGSDENVYVVGSLALNKAFRSDGDDVKLKRRRVNMIEAHTVTYTDVLNRGSKRCLVLPNSLPAHSSTAPASPHSPIEDSRDDESFDDSLNHNLYPVSLSLLDESPANYRHDTNSMHSNDESVPRTFSRVIGETSFTNLYTRKQDKFKTEEGLPSREILSLPSQVAEGEDFYEELSFYRH